MQITATQGHSYYYICGGAKNDAINFFQKNMKKCVDTWILKIIINNNDVTGMRDIPVST